MKSLPKKYINIILIYTLLILSICPLISLTKSAVPAGDDFTYGVKARHAYTQEDSVFKAIQAAVETTKDKYMNWQGTYSSILLMSINPAVFSVKLYRIAALILIFIIIICPFILAAVINKYIFNGKTTLIYCFSAVFTFLIFQFMPSVYEGIYWFNGAWYYVFSFNLVLLLVAQLIVFSNIHNKFFKYIMFILSILNIIYLGGTNIPQVLYLAVISSMFILYIFIKRKKNKWMYFILWSILGLCITINVFAPGNMVHIKSHVNLTYTAFSMLRFMSEEFSTNSATYLMLAFCISMLPFINKILKDNNIVFINPILLVAASFLVYFSMFTPAAFMFNNGGPVRSQNIRLMMSLLFILVNYFNICGYCYNKDKNSLNANKPIIFILTLFILLAGIRDDSIVQMNSIQAKYSIMGLDVDKFTTRIDEFFVQLEDNQKETVEIEKLYTHEMLLPSLDLYKDFSIGYYYQKDEVIY